MNRKDLISLIKECIHEIAISRNINVREPNKSEIDTVVQKILKNLYGTPPILKKLSDPITESEFEELESWAAEKLEPAKNGVLINFKTMRLNHNLEDGFVSKPNDIVDVYVYVDPAANLHNIQDAINDTPKKHEVPHVFWLSPEYVADSIFGYDIRGRIVIPGIT